MPLYGTGPVQHDAEVEHVCVCSILAVTGMVTMGNCVVLCTEHKVTIIMHIQDYS